MSKIFLYTIVSLMTLSSGCAFVKKKAEIIEEGKPTEIQKAESAAPEPRLPGSELFIDEKPSAKDVEQLTLPSYEKTQPEKPLPEVKPIDPKRLVSEENPVMINVDSMPLSDFIVYTLSNTLKVTYFVDEAVKKMKNPLTLRMVKEVPPETALEIVIDILRQKNLIVKQRGNSLYILYSKPERDTPLDVRFGRTVPESEAEIAQFVSFKHIQFSSIRQLINKLYSKDVKITQYPRENAVLIIGEATVAKNVVNLIEMFDVPYIREKKLSMFHLTYWRPDEFIEQITIILESIGFTIAKSSRDPGISFIPIEVLNNILIVTPDDKTMKVVIEWKDRLDTPEAAGEEEKAFVYTPLYSRAADLAKSIKNLYIISIPEEKEKGKGAVKEELKIEADDRSNLIGIVTTPSRYKEVLILLEKLDIPPKQVLIETTIAELTLKDDLAYGLEWFLKNTTYDKGPYSFQSLGESGGLGGAGLLFSWINESGNFGTLMSAFAKEDKINILSRPRLMVLDNVQASIQVGTEVPIATSQTEASTQTDGNTDVFRGIEMQSTGMTLDVTPTINTEGLLTLSISVDLDEAQDNTTSDIDSPIILTRRVRTEIVVQSGQSVLLGGLMSEDTSETVSKIPFLGDIPFLGNLFKTTSIANTKTELIVMITPTILTNTDDATRLTDELKKELTWLK